MSYRPQLDHIARATGPAQWWRIVLVLIVMFAVAFGIALVLAVFIRVAFPAYWEQMSDAAFGRLFVLGNLAIFAAFALGLWVGVRLLHGRGLRSMIGPPPAFLRCFAVVAAVAIVAHLIWFLLLPEMEPASSRSPIPMGDWLLLLPVLAITVLIQTGAEELVFRGYLQQQLGRLSTHPIVWMVLPSLLFGLIHLGNEPGPNAWLYVVATGLSGLLWADLTARTGNLGAACALHFSNNFLAFGLVSNNDEMGWLALYLFDFDWSVPVPLLTASVWLFYEVVIWLLARVVLRV